MLLSIAIQPVTERSKQGTILRLVKVIAINLTNPTLRDTSNHPVNFIGKFNRIIGTATVFRKMLDTSQRRTCGHATNTRLECFDGF